MKIEVLGENYTGAQSAADEVVYIFRTATKTISLATIAMKHKKFVNRICDLQKRNYKYEFNDGSFLMVAGRGKNHNYWISDHN